MPSTAPPDEMTPEQWRLVGDLFAQAAAVPVSERDSWLATADAPEGVRAEVAALLEAHDRDDHFLEHPPDEARLVEAPSAPDPALVPGAMVGAYRLIRELGRGAMGVVFEAEDTRLHRRVALKAVASSAHDAGDQRLRHEARAAAALVHPNIATIYALDDIDGRAYISSEMLEGETLRDVLARGPLSRDATLDITHALASALDVAHAHGIVHRDLKPENVLRLADGRVKILDFGIARLEGDARRLRSSTGLTLQGLVAGTPGYMAPEQLLGEDIDGRTDQYALGALLAELATGRNPFDGGSVAASIALAMKSDGLPVPLDGARVAPDIAAIASRCTRHRREDRFTTTAEVVAALAACRRDAALAPTITGTPASAVGPAGAGPRRDPETGRRPALWWWRFHQAAAAAIYWLMIVPAWLVHRDLPRGLPWFLGCLAATIVAANVRLHLRFSAAVLPQELPAQRARTRGWVAIADWTLILLWAFAGTSLLDGQREWSVVFFAFAVGAALAVGLIEPATTRAAFTVGAARPQGASTSS